MANKANNRSLLFSCIALLCSLVVAGSALFAWFANANPRGNLEAGVKSDTDSGMVIDAINGGNNFDRNLMFYPGDTMDVTLKAVKDEISLSDFQVKFEVTTLNVGGAFESAFNGRDDLLLGGYQTVTMVDGSPVYKNFNIDTYLDGKGYTGTQKRNAMIAFLKLFATQNRLTDALAIAVVQFSQMGEEELPVDWQEHYERHPEIVDLFYIPYSWMLLYIGDYCTIRIEYGRYFDADWSVREHFDYLPTMQVTNENNMGIFENGTYAALNYNCFIGQTLKILFGKEI